MAKIYGNTTTTPMSPEMIVSSKAKQFANALKGNKSGSTVKIDDVSPVEHNLNINLSSDTITDFSNVKVTRLGKNLFDIANPKTCGYNDASLIYPVKIENGIIYSGGGYGISDGMLVYIPTYGYDAITFSYDVKYDSESVSHAGAAIRTFDGVDDNKLAVNRVLTRFNLSTGHQTHTVETSGKAYVGISWLGTSRYDMQITNLQIEFGDTATEYEPYIEPQTVTANVDGKIENVLSISPNITLVSDTDGAIINCEYNRDINKAFAELQQVILNNL